MTNYHYGKFPPHNIDGARLQPLLNQARTALGRYDGLLMAITNPHVLLSPLFKQEAVLSSKIEGTQSSLSEVLEFEANTNSKQYSQEKRDDILEIINYRSAIQKTIELLGKYPLSQRVLLESHKILMRGVRGKNRSPGEYRKIPNWIGADRTNRENARFIPISADKINDAMTLWEKYIHENNRVDDLLKVAILHAEFEALHPFLDGNGRLGRIFIPLYLWQKSLIQSPSFYISAYFERNRQAYYDYLLGVSHANDWTSWCQFFLQGVLEQAQNNQSKAKKILDLYNELKTTIPSSTKSQYGIIALDFVFKEPHFRSKSFYEKANIPRPTAQRLLRVFCEKEILLRIKGAWRTSNFYLFKKLLNIAEGQDIL